MEKTRERGRPELPPEERRDQRYVIKLTAAEKDLITAAGDTVWAREVLLRAARRLSR